MEPIEGPFTRAKRAREAPSPQTGDGPFTRARRQIQTQAAPPIRQGRVAPARTGARPTTTGTSAVTTRRQAPQRSYREALYDVPDVPLIASPPSGQEAPPETLGGDLWNAARRGVLSTRAAVNEIGAQFLPGSLGERDARIADELAGRARAIPTGRTVARVESFLGSMRPASGDRIDELADGERSSVPAGFEGILPERYLPSREQTLRDAAEADPLGTLRYGAVKATESLPGMAPSLAAGALTGGASLPVQIGAQFLVNAPPEIGGQLQDAAHDEFGQRREVSGRAKMAAVVTGGASSVVESVADRALVGAVLDGARPAAEALRRRLARLAGDALVEAPLKEGSTEAGQQVLQNAGAIVGGWDEDRSLLQGVPEAAFIGGLMGGGVAGAGGAVGVARGRTLGRRAPDVGAQTPADVVAAMDDAALQQTLNELGDVPWRDLDPAGRATFTAAANEATRRAEGVAGPVVPRDARATDVGVVDDTPIDYRISGAVTSAPQAAPTAAGAVAALDALPPPTSPSDLQAREQVKAEMEQAATIEAIEPESITDSRSDSRFNSLSEPAAPAWTERDVEDALERGDDVPDEVLAAHPRIEGRWRPFNVAESIEPDEEITNEDYIDAVTERSTDAAEIAAAWQSARTDDAPEAEGSVAQALEDWRRAGGRIDTDSFAAFGDRAHLAGSGIAPRWLRAGGTGVDGVAMSLSEATGREVTPQEVVDAITARRETSPAAAQAAALQERYRAVTGRSLTEREASRILEEYYASTYSPADDAVAPGPDPDFDPLVDDVPFRRGRGPRQQPVEGLASDRTRERRRIDKSDAEAVVSSVDLGRVSVVATEAELPGLAQARIIFNGAEGQVGGIYETATGRVYLVTENLPRGGDGALDAYEVARTIAHEAVGHAGVRALLGTQTAPFMRRVWREYSDHPAMQEIVGRYRLETSTEAGRMEAAEEFIAHRAEDDAFQKAGVMKRLRYLVREALRRMAEKISGGRWSGPELSDADIAALIQQAARARATTGAKDADVRLSRRRREAETWPLSPRALDNLTPSEAALQEKTMARAAKQWPDLLRQYAKTEATAGGRVIDTDLFRELFPEYRADRAANVQAVHAAASSLAVRAYEQATRSGTLRGKDVAILAGGGGSGKGLARARALAEDRALILDTTLSNMDAAVERIEQAKAAGARVRLSFTYRPIERAVEGAVRRYLDEGRPVPLHVLAADHLNAQRVFLGLPKRYADDDNVSFNVTDNSGGFGEAREVNLAFLESVAYNDHTEAYARALSSYDAFLDRLASESNFDRAAIDAAFRAGDRRRRGRSTDSEVQRAGDSGEGPAQGEGDSGGLTSGSLLQRRAPGDIPRRVDASREGTLYAGDPDGARRQADLANPGQTPDARALVEAADSQRFEQGDPRTRTRAEMQAGADAAVAFDRAGVLDRLRDGEALDTPEKVLAAMQAVSDAAAAAVASGDSGAMSDAALLVHRYREARAETARALGAGTDPSETPEMRRRRLIVESVIGIDERTAESLRALREGKEGQAATRARVMAAEAEARRAAAEKAHDKDAARLTDARRDAAAAEAELERTRADLAAAIAEAQKRRRAIEASAKDAERDLAAEQRAARDLTRKRAELREQTDFQRGRVATLQSEIRTLETGVARKADELAALRQTARETAAKFKQAERRLKSAEEREAQRSARRGAKARAALASIGVDLAEVASYQGDGGARPAGGDSAPRRSAAPRTPSPDAAAARADADAAREAFEAKRAALIDRMREKGMDVSNVRFSRGDGQASGIPELPESMDFGGDAELEAMYLDMMNAAADARIAEAKARRLESASGDGVDTGDSVPVGADDVEVVPSAPPPVLTDPVLAMEAITVALRARGGQGWARALEYYRASLLSAPATHVVNNVSNALNLLVSYGLERPVEALIGSLTPGETRYEGATLGELPRLYGALLSGRTYYTAMRRAAMAFRMEIPVTAASLGFEQATQGHEVHTGAIPGKVGRAVRVPLRLLGMADEVAKSIITSMEIGAQAYRIAKQEGLDGDALDARIREIVDTPGSDAALLALDAAAKRTFQNLDDALVSEMERRGLGRSENAGGKVSSGITMLRREIPPLAFVLPFITTPANILARAARLTPLGIVPLAVKYRTLPPGAARARVAEMLVGSAITMALMGLAGGEDEEGRPYLTGSAPGMRESAKREMGQRAFPPASILIGDRYYSYARLTPLASLLTLAADGHAAMQGVDAGKENPYARVFDAAITQVRDQSFLAGIGDIIRAVEEPGKGIPNWASRFATGWVPNLVRSGLRARIGEQLDNRAKSLGGIVPATLQQAAPGIVQAEAKVDVWGRTLLADGGPIGGAAGDYLWRLTTPVRSQKADGVHAADLLIRRYNLSATGQDGHEEYYPQLPGRSGWLQDATPERYWGFVRRRGELARVQIESDIAAGKLNVEVPSARDVERIRVVLEKAGEIAKEEIVGKPKRTAPDPVARSERRTIEGQMRRRAGDIIRGR